MSLPTIHTIGYEGLSIDEFLSILKKHKINLVVDVRELPLSRKQGFSKNQLAKALSEIEIEYIHMRDLGAPREIRYALRENGDWDKYCKLYLSNLRNRTELLEELSSKAKVSRIVLLCFERDFEVCHRSLISQRMLELGLLKAVKHISKVGYLELQRGLACA